MWYKKCTINNLAHNVSCKFKSSLDFCKEHKEQIIGGAILIGVSTFAIYEGAQNKNLIAQNNSLRKMTKELNEDIDALQIAMVAQSLHIRDLENLIEEKDRFFDHAIGEGLKNGGAFAAQQMAAKRWNKSFH